MKKILMIIHTFPPIGSVGGSIRIVKFLKYIQELNANIHSTIITLTDKKVLLNDFHLAKSSLSEIPKDNIKIIRTNTLQPKHPNPEHYNQSKLVNAEKISPNKFALKKLVKKIYQFLEKTILIPDYGILWFPFSIRTALKEIKDNKIDFIYATAPPFSVLLQAVIIKKITNKKLVIDIKDDWIYQTIFLSRPFLFRKIEEKLERFCIKNSDKIILVTQRSFDDFVERYSEIEERFELITNGCDVQEYIKFWDIEKKKNSKFKIIHSGVLAVSRDPKGFFSSLVQLKKEGIISEENFEVKFIGVLHATVVSLIHENQLDDIVISTGVLDRDKYVDEINSADLLLAFNYQLKTIVPGKLYDYWGARNPILLIDSLDSIAANLVRENKLGIVKEFEDVAGIKNSIESYVDSWKKGTLNHKSNIENLYNYDRKKLTQKLISIFETI